MEAPWGQPDGANARRRLKPNRGLAPSYRASIRVRFSPPSIGAVAQPANLLQGTLDLLILKSLSTGELHGLGLARRIEQITKGTFVVKPGSLFPALYRMEDAGWLTSAWGTSENNRRAKFYSLTTAGRSQLKTEVSQWKRIALAISFALEAS